MNEIHCPYCRRKTESADMPQKCSFCGAYVPPIPPKRFVFSTDTGSVVIEFPSRINPDDLPVLMEWFDLVKRKIARGAA